ncbi:integrase (plasmid) [Pusillimonas sp. T7-7]|uniref:tyrosine-type recombinase/integrase n=1 Tax=Pusillimonas sp. (strain T7-7) TaxID=1007105 RepID=UPI0002084A94|nr:tyrosine-type recombinase/integrase [Pusillimonas sp. T7-7]AEC22265.1 integrase [Pusillimonas sp. T7-7]
MASFRKSGKGWRAEVARNSVRESATFPTKREAQEWAAKRETELSARKGGKVIRWSLSDVLDKYLREITPTKRGATKEAIRIKAFQRDELAQKVMQDVTPADLADWRDKRVKSVKPASALREISTLRAVWAQARKGEWNYTDQDPWKEVTKPEPGKARTTTFTDDQVKRIVAALGYDGGQPSTKRKEAAVALLFSLETAMRAGEIVGLQWEHVHLDKRLVHLPESKNEDARDVPLSKKAVALLECMKGLNDERVFTLNSALLDTYYRSGRALAGIKGPTFHDARATAITLLSKKLDILELARMVGHRDPRSLMIYYRASATDIAAKLD